MEPRPIEPVSTDRLLLDPLTVAMADEMVHVLGSPELYTYTGGQAPALDQLRRRYAAQVVGGSADGEQRWLNWVVRLRDGGEPVGCVQATLEGSGDSAVAEVAWVVGVAHQRQGIASEAAAAMVGWLRSLDVRTVRAHIHPEHDASVAVAQRLGLEPTAIRVDGEIRWEDPAEMKEGPVEPGPSSVRGGT